MVLIHPASLIRRKEEVKSSSGGRCLRLRAKSRFSDSELSLSW